MNEAFKIHAEVQGKKEFDRVMKDYLQFIKRQVSEIINAKLYFIALQIMKFTKKADANDILSKLRAPSRKYPDAPLESILINLELKRRGKRGLSGSKMADAIGKFEKRAVSHIQFLRSGWLPAMKKLDFWNKRGDISFVKRFAPKQPTGIKQYGKEKGDAIYAKPNVQRTWGKIMNYIGQGKQESPTVEPLLRAGLNRGIMEEIKSMRFYIEKKLKEKFDKINNTKTI